MKSGAPYLLIIFFLACAFCHTIFSEELSFAQNLEEKVGEFIKHRRYPEALKFLENELRQAEGRFGKDSLQAADCHYAIGVIHEAICDFKNTEESFHKAIAIREKILGSNSKELIDPLIRLSGVQAYSRARYDVAEVTLLRALKICESNLGENSKEAGECRRQLANLYEITDNDPKTEAEYLKIISVLETAGMADSLNMAETVSQLGKFYSEKSFYPEAEKLIVKAKEICFRHPEELNYEAVIERVKFFYWYDVSDLPEAEKVFMEELEILGKRFGEESEKCADARIRFANFYSDNSKFAEAETILAEALAIYRKHLKPDDPKIINNEAVLEWLSKRKTGAKGNYQSKPVDGQALQEKELLGKLAESEKVFGKDSPDTAEILIQLGDFYWISYLQKIPEAENSLNRSLEILENKFGKNSSATIKPLEDLLYVCMADDPKNTKAEKAFKSALKAYELNYGKDHPILCELLVRYAWHCQSWERNSEAERYFIRITSILKKHYGKDDPMLIQNLRDLYQFYASWTSYPLTRRIYEKIYWLYDSNPYKFAYIDDFMSRMDGILPYSKPKYAAMEKTLKRIVDISEKQYGKNSILNIQNLYQSTEMCDYSDPADDKKIGAERDRILKIYEINFGAESPFMIRAILENIYGLGEADTEKAIRLYKKAMAISEKKFGKDHPLIVTILRDLAATYDQQGINAEAIECYERALAICAEKRIDCRSYVDIVSRAASFYETKGYREKVTILNDLKKKIQTEKLWEKQ